MSLENARAVSFTNRRPSRESRGGTKGFQLRGYRGARFDNFLVGLYTLTF